MGAGRHHRDTRTLRPVFYASDANESSDANHGGGHERGTLHDDDQNEEHDHDH